MEGTKIDRTVIKSTKTVVTLEEKQYKQALRLAVGAPADADVTIEDNYGGDITITWTVVEYPEGDQ